MSPDAVLPHIASRTKNRALAAKRRVLIGEAATRLFSKRGFHATTIEEIAGEAGLSVGSIYRYVKKKEDILLLVIDQALEFYESALSPVRELDCPPAKKLWLAMEAYYGIISRNPGRVDISYRDSWVLDKDARDYIKSRELETNRHLEQIIKEGIDRGVFRNIDPHLITYDVVLFGHMWALKAWHFRSQMTFEEYLEKQYEIVLAFLLAPGDAERSGQRERMGAHRPPQSEHQGDSDVSA